MRIGIILGLLLSANVAQAAGEFVCKEVRIDRSGFGHCNSIGPQLAAELQNCDTRLPFTLQQTDQSRRDGDFGNVYCWDEYLVCCTKK